MASWVSSAVTAVAGCAVSAVTAIAGSAASTVVDKIVQTGFSYVQNRMLAKDSEAELKRLEMALPQIREVMAIAEALKMKDPSLGAWFVQFRNAVDASEDVLDELEYKELEDMAKNRCEAGGSASCSKKMKRSGLINDDTLTRLKDAVRMLDEAAANVKHVQQRAAELGVRGISELQQETHNGLRRETTSFLTERKLFGRKVEKERIIGWLKQPSHNCLSCFSVIGVGGLGKTTLTQFAYQEMSKSDLYDKRIWVCVSTNFTVEQITQKILGELGERCCDGKPLNALQETLKEKISSKKIFLVFDDVWDDENRSDWEQLLAPLQFVQQGSKILLTTRFQSVAYLLGSVVNVESEPLVLQGLPVKELLELFNSYAFHGFNPDNYENLQSIGNQMVKMLKGSPLAAKVIGSLLNSRMDHLYWRRVLDRSSLFNLDQANDVMEVLKLSYYHLPANLQVCFRFCSIFPQDYNFDKDQLIKMWMAVGFLKQNSCPEERAEDIGEDYFNHLLRKSFFECSYGNIYIMHDLIHELAQKVSKGECSRIEQNDKPVVIPSSVRHISVHESAIERISHLENLHSLVITNSGNASVQTDPFVLPSKLNKKSLRLLKISLCHSCHLSEEISSLVHLRYISIALDIGVEPKCSFPTSIHNLYHLQVLEFSGLSHNQFYLGIDPSKMTNLVKLRYMRLPQEIMRTIHGVHNLTSLRELSFIVEQKSGHRINELRALNNLCDLTINNIENVTDLAEAKSANLLGKENLKSLSLVWTSNSNSENSELMLDNLQPNPNLMKLTIKNYTGQRSPSWMENSSALNLSSLNLLCCPSWKDQLSCQMPYLKYLSIVDCPKLDHLPDMPLSLIKFYVQGVGLTCLPNMYTGNDTIAAMTQKSSLHSVTIGKCPSLISLDGFLHQGNFNLQAIENLTINECEALVDVPTQGFTSLTSLKYLRLRDCPNLVVADSLGNLIPENLKELQIRNCGELDVPLLKASSRLTTLTKLSIETCRNVRELTVTANSFRSLKSLTISDCRNLEELLFPLEVERVNEDYSFDVLQIDHLKLENCPNLTRFPILPHSVTILKMCNVVVTDLPKYYSTSTDLSGPPPFASLKPSLRQMIIESCPQLTSLNGLMQQEEYVDFQSIKIISIRDCSNLVQIPIGAFGKFGSLIDLKVENCPNLTIFPILPLSVTTLKMCNVGVSNLPEYCSTSTDLSGGPPFASLKPSLRQMDIKNCPQLASLNGLMQQEEYKEFQSINFISIWDCSNLVHIPIGGFQKFGSLIDLRIGECPMLVAGDNQANILPMTLERLTIRNCGELEVQLLESASHLTSLTSLWIINCANITHISCSENAFRSVSLLSIRRCDKLVQHSARDLERGVNMASLKISSLYIDTPSLLNIEPLRSLRSVSELTISNCSGMDVFPEQWLLQNSSTLKILKISPARTLKSLPATILRFTDLTELRIFKCDLLEQIQGLPASLRILRIYRAKSLKSLPTTMASYTSLEELEIYGAELLTVLPRLPASLRTMKIQCANSLTSLPATMADLTALEYLEISKADLLQELPELPRSLKFKSITRSDGTEIC